MRNLLLIFLLILAFLSSALHAAPSAPDVIYGEDNRKDIEEVVDDYARQAAASVAGRVYNDFLRVQDNKFSYDTAPSLSDPYGGNVCEGEAFASQPVVADCSAFLVGEDLLATAGHCVLDYPAEVKDEKTPGCELHSWVFDFQTRNGKVNLKDVQADNLYACEKVVYALVDRNTDIALIKLDRKVKGRKPLKLRSFGKVNDGEELFVIGHPSGLPLKYADGATVFDNSNDEYFSANLDTFSGNSGSPVFNARTRQVEGILTRGKADYVDSGFCRKANVCDEDGKNCLMPDDDIDAEHVNRLDKLAAFL